MNKQDWTYKKLGEVATIYDSQRKPVTKKDRVNGIYPYYGATGIQDYVDSYLFDGRYLLLGEDGAKWGANDKSAFIIEGKSWVNNHAHIMRFDDRIIDSFVEYYLNGKDLTEYITGAVVPKLTQAKLTQIPIPVPPIEEQERIVAELDLLSGIIEKKKEQLKAYDQLAQSIFYDMFGDPFSNEKGWEMSCFGYIMTPAKSNKCKSHSELPILSITMHGGIVRQNERFKKVIASKDVTGYKIIKRGQLVIAFPIDEGLIYTQDIEDEGIMSPAYNVWDVDYKKVETLFLKFHLHSPSIMKYYKDKLRGTTLRRRMIPKEDLLNLPIPLPPLSLQQEFAEKVKAIEQQKALVQQSIEETQTMFDYTMDKYFG